jgi:hypothetical protein
MRPAATCLHRLLSKESDDLAAARGITIGLALSLLLWMLIATLAL